jgi:large subunit ribosomal protein L10
MNRTEKATAVEALGQELSQADTAILFGFAGLKVTEVTELRRQVRGTRSKYIVVKNTLARRAVQGTPLEAMSELFEGPTAVVYNKANAVALARVLTTFAKTNPNLVFKGAFVEGKAVAAKEIAAIADLPSREELVSKLLFLVQSPLRRLVMVLNGPVRGLAVTLHQIAEQKSKSGEAGAAPAN